MHTRTLTHQNAKGAECHITEIGAGESVKTKSGIVLRGPAIYLVPPQDKSKALVFSRYPNRPGVADRLELQLAQMGYK